jgi:exonuclease SbcD
VETYGKTDPATGLSSRLVDFLASLDSLVDFALENKVDLVLFCGDAYKSREPSQTQQRELARRINRLSAAGIPVFLLVGNHDLPNAIGRATATEIFDTLAVKNVHVSDSHPPLAQAQLPAGKVKARRSEQP